MTPSAPRPTVLPTGPSLMTDVPGGWPARDCSDGTHNGLNVAPGLAEQSSAARSRQTEPPGIPTSAPATSRPH